MEILLLLKKQLKSNSIVISYALAFCVLILGMVLGIHYFNDIPLKILTSDVTAVADVPVYYGLLSQIGIFFWASTAAICFISAHLIYGSIKSFYLVSGMVSLFLGVDDVFLFHEIVFPAIGIHQKIVYLSYAILMSFYVFKFYKTILKTDFILLGLAFGCFGLSLFIDNFAKGSSPLVTKLIEDGSKFIGIVCWTFYFYQTARKSLVTLRIV